MNAEGHSSPFPRARERYSQGEYGSNLCRGNYHILSMDVDRYTGDSMFDSWEFAFQGCSLGMRRSRKERDSLLATESYCCWATAEVHQYDVANTGSVFQLHARLEKFLAGMVMASIISLSG